MTRSPATVEPDTDDTRPIPADRRTMSGYDMAGLWASMVVNLPNFYLVGGLLDLGMSWQQSIATIFAGTAILLLPLILTSSLGVRYGVPFPVLLRASFGVRGAHVPALLRALVATGWAGIESSIAAQALALLLPFDTSAWYSRRLPSLATSPLELACFLLVSLAQLAILRHGMPLIRLLQRYSAPVLVALTAWLFAWAYLKAGGLAGMLAGGGDGGGAATFWPVFLPSLTASVSCWSGVALNIPDFTRYARSQAGQVSGQLPLPLFVAAYSFAGLAIASSTVTIFGRLVTNPIEILRLIGGVPVTVLAIVGISLATVTTNIPANFVAPANALVALSPTVFSFSGGAAVTAVASVAFQPWRILDSSESFVYKWLVGYSAVLGPIAGVVLADYYIVRRGKLDVPALYSGDSRGEYYYSGGYNVAAFMAMAAAVGPAVPGFLYKAGVVAAPPPVVFVGIYDDAWFFGVFSAAAVYWVLCWWWGVGVGGRVGGDAAEPLLNPVSHDPL